MCDTEPNHGNLRAAGERVTPLKLLHNIMAQPNFEVARHGEEAILYCSPLNNALYCQTKHVINTNTLACKQGRGTL